MNLTQDQIARLAKLSSLDPHTNLEISGIINAISCISVPSDQKMPTFEVAPMQLRPDTVQDIALADELLACSPQRVAAHQIVLSGIMHGE